MIRFNWILLLFFSKLEKYCYHAELLRSRKSSAIELLRVTYSSAGNDRKRAGCRPNEHAWPIWQILSIDYSAIRSTVSSPSPGKRDEDGAVS